MTGPNMDPCQLLLGGERGSLQEMKACICPSGKLL